MKSKTEIKAALHQLIDGIDDEALLTLLMGDIIPYVIAHRNNKPANPDNTAGDDQNTPSPSSGHIDEINAADWESFKPVQERKSTDN